ncbi:MAG: hypothetical protein WDM76_18605 [Limisphaerales bacterium]
MNVPLPRPPAWICDLTTTLALAARGNFLRRRSDLGERFGGNFERDEDAVSGEQLLGLVFVDIHFKIGRALKTIGAGNQLLSTGSKFIPKRGTAGPTCSMKA